MAKIGEETVLEHIADRLRALEDLGVETVFAIADEDDHALADFLREKRLKFSIGEPLNVLRRYVDAAADLADTDFVVRATGDNPFIDKNQLAGLIRCARDLPFDYGYTADLPLGMGTELIRVNALRSVEIRALPLRPGEESPLKPHHTEHVTTYIREHPFLYDIFAYHLDDNFSEEAAKRRVEGIRLTIDEPADLEVARKIFDHFNRLGNPHFGAIEVIGLAKNNPEMFAANAAVIQKLATSYQRVKKLTQSP